MAFAILLLAGTHFATAQNFYLSPSVGFGLNTPGEVAFGGDTSQTTVQNINLGGGINAGVSGIWMFDENFGLEVRLNYQNNLGDEVNSRVTDFDTVNFSPTLSDEVATTNSYSLRLTPLLFFRMERDFSPYAKVGPVVQLSGLSTSFESSGTNVMSFESELEYAPVISLGGAAEAGILFELSDGLTCNAGVSLTMVQMGLKSAEVTSYKENGRDRLDDLNTAAKEIEFKETVTNQDLNNSPDEPTVTNKDWVNFSNVTLRVGVMLEL